jgi:hypothetical protein
LVHAGAIKINNPQRHYEKDEYKEDPINIFKNSAVYGHNIRLKVQPEKKKFRVRRKNLSVASRPSQPMASIFG